MSGPTSLPWATLCLNGRPLQWPLWKSFQMVPSLSWEGNAICQHQISRAARFLIKLPGYEENRICLTMTACPAHLTHSSVSISEVDVEETTQTFSKLWLQHLWRISPQSHSSAPPTSNVKMCDKTEKKKITTPLFNTPATTSTSPLCATTGDLMETLTRSPTDVNALLIKDLFGLISS